MGWVEGHRTNLKHETSESLGGLSGEEEVTFYKLADSVYGLGVGNGGLDYIG